MRLGRGGGNSLVPLPSRPSLPALFSGSMSAYSAAEKRSEHPCWEATVRLTKNNFECSLCGAPLDVPVDKAPSVVIVAASGKPNERIIVLDSLELHRCPIGSNAP